MAACDDPAVNMMNSVFDLAKENYGIFTNMTLLNMLLMSLVFDKKDKPFPKTSSTFDEEYDYIIVGGGTAGSVMANRLSQKPCVRVLLLEAGGYAPLLIDVPSAARIFYGSEVDWGYKTIPQKNCAFGQIDNRVGWSSGKALGGSSILNAMVSIRGNHKDYDNWEAEGATGWSYKDVLPFFIKLENAGELRARDIDLGYHGTDGPLTVETIRYIPEIKFPLLQAAVNLGYEIRDCNGKRQIGVFDLQGTLRNGQRCSTAKAYLVPAEDRPNLTILKNAFVRKILILNKIAYGVEFDFEREGNTRIVLARKEVIISVGSVRTPQLLMLSGIGPREELEKHNIPVVANLPVGKNLQDHCNTFLAYLLDSTIVNVFLKNLDPANIFKYIASRTGPLASPDQLTLVAFLDGLNTTSTSPDTPRQELYIGEFAAIDAFKNFNLKPEVYSQVYGKYPERSMYKCVVSLLQPKSRGEIRLNSTDPYVHPVIDPKYYEDESDLKAVVEGMKICQALAKSPEMQALGAESFDILFPGCEMYINDEDQLFACRARSLTNTHSHPVGTTRMGHPNDPRSVVDPQLKVIGVKNLRVVNAAVMPIIPSGNTNVPTMMVAERVYDMMKDDVICTWDGNAKYVY